MSANEPEGIRQSADRAMNEQLAVHVWGQYGERLQRLARSRLPDGLQRRVGSDDIVQSACRTFFRRLQGGQLEIRSSESLWSLLCAITLNKTRMQVRRHTRGRRSVRRETQVGEAKASDFAGEEATSEEIVLFQDQLANLLEKLSPQQRLLVQLKLEEKSSAEIAQQLGCSERTLRRMMSQVRGVLKAELLDSWSDA